MMGPCAPRMALASRWAADRKQTWSGTDRAVMPAIGDGPTASRTSAWWLSLRAGSTAPSEPDAGSSVRRNALGVFSIRVLSAALLFVSQIILARWIGAADYGLYVALWSAVLVVGGLSHFGLSTAMMRLAPEYQASKSLDLLRGLLFGGRALAIGGGLVTAFAGALALWVIGPTSYPGFSLAVFLTLACLPAYALTEAQDGLGRGQGWTLESIAPPYVLRPALILIFAAGSYFLSFPATVVTAIACALAATWLTALVQTVLVQRRIRQAVSAGAAIFQFPVWLRISLPLLAVSGSELVLQNADVLLLTALRSPEEVGVYYAAAKTTCLALFVHYAVGSAYSGRFATAGALGDRDGLQRLTREAVQWTFWPSVAVTVSVLAAGPYLLALFGDDFKAAYPAMFILSVGLLARAATGPSEFVLNMLGRQNDCARSFAIAAGVSIALNLALIPVFGAFGAAFATACAFATASILNWRTARRELGLNLFVFAKAGPAAISPRGPIEPLHGLTAQFASDATLDLEIIRDEAGFAALGDDWNRLYEACAASSQPFMSFAWHQHWLRHYHADQSHPLGVQLAVAVGRRNGRAVVIWPLVTKHMAGMTYLYWMGQPVSQYGDVLVEASPTSDAVLRDSWDMLVLRLAPDVISLRKVRADAAVADLLKAKGAVSTHTEQAPFVSTVGHASFDAFEARYAAKARKNRRRLLRRLEEKGTVEFVHVAGGKQAADLARKAIALKRDWLAQRGLLSTALHDARFERFFKAACAGTADAACCVVSALKLDGQPLAIMVSVANGARLSGHIFAFDLNHEKSGVGVLLMEECLRYAVTNGYAVFDLSAPGDAYKYDWCDQQLEVCDWALASSLRGHLFTRLHLTHVRSQAKQAVKRLPTPVRKILRAVLQRTAAARAALPSQPPHEPPARASAP